MTIERGRTWGSLGPRPAGSVTVATDGEARTVVERAWRAGEPLPPLHLVGGDLWRTCGGRPPQPGGPGLGDEATADHALLPADLGLVEVDGEVHVFVAHLVLRGPTWWVGDVAAVMNAQYIEAWDVAPRAHPNDGRLDLLEVSGMRPSDRWKAWRRLPSGAHVPHPKVGERRIAEAVLEHERPRRLWLDGGRVGEATRVTVRCLPDALLLCV